MQSVNVRRVFIKKTNKGFDEKQKEREREKSTKCFTNLSAFMNSNRLVTLLVASTTSCFANIGPISLYTFAPSSKDFNSSNTISFSVACCVNVFRASMFACSSVFHRRNRARCERERERESQFLPRKNAMNKKNNLPCCNC